MIGTSIMTVFLMINTVVLVANSAIMMINSMQIHKEIKGASKNGFN